MKVQFIHSQQLQRVQKVRGYQPHHGLQRVPHFHDLQQYQSLPMEESNNVSEVCISNIVSLLINQL